MIPLDAAVAATGARILGAGRVPAWLSLSTDTRAIGPGQVFVALTGPTYDGHDFVREALVRGAAACVVERDSALPPNTPALIVRDTTAAYLAFGAVARTRVPAAVVGITGSTGKTTTKALLAQLLARATGRPVAATPGNENNEIGVAKLLLSLESDAAFVVAEFGARHYGEIEPLARAARPDVAILTNIGEAHLEIMGSRERLAQTKWGIFATGARPVLAVADVESRRRGAGREDAWWFAAGDERDDAAMRHCVRLGAGRLAVRIDGAETVRAVDVRIAGGHNHANLAAALAAALALGVPLDDLVAAVPHLELPPGRYERSRVADLDVIYDAYNASMSGTIATLASFAAEPATRRIAVLGSMAELGPDAPEMHERVGEAAAKANLHALLVGGPHATELTRGARRGGFAAADVVEFATNDAAADWLAGNARPGDVVLLKASRRYRLEEIIVRLGSGT